MTSKGFITCLALLCGPASAVAGCAFDLAEDGAPVEGEVGGVAIELRWSGGREFDFIEWILEIDQQRRTPAASRSTMTTPCSRASSATSTRATTCSC